MAARKIEKLLDAIKKGQISDVKKLINGGIDCHAFVQDPENNDRKLTYLHFAVRNGQRDVVKYLAEEQNVDVNQRDSLGIPPLNDAAYFGYFEILQVLIKNGANCNARARDVYEDSACHRAALKGRSDIIKYLVEEKGCNINARNSDGATPLHAAASYGDLAFLKFAINLGADCTAIDFAGRSALFYANVLNSVSVREYLIEEKKLDANNPMDNLNGSALHFYSQFPMNQILQAISAKGKLDHESVKALTDSHAKSLKHVINACKLDVNECNEKGDSPLHLACLRGELNVVKTLVDQGSNCDALNSNGCSVLHCAAAAGKHSIVRYLINKKNLDVNMIAKTGITPLHSACLFGDMKTIQLLINKGADVFALDDRGWSCLHVAVSEGHTSVVRYLVEQKRLDVIKRDEEHGYSPLVIACHNGYLEIVKILLKNGADLNSVDGRGEPVLHIATITGHRDICEYLLREEKLNVNKCNRIGISPLHIACELGNLSIVKELIRRGADRNAVDAEGNNCLHFAARTGNANAISYLIDEEGVDVNGRDTTTNATALIMACFGRFRYC